MQLNPLIFIYAHLFLTVTYIYMLSVPLKTSIFSVSQKGQLGFFGGWVGCILDKVPVSCFSVHTCIKVSYLISSSITIYYSYLG